MNIVITICNYQDFSTKSHYFNSSIIEARDESLLSLLLLEKHVGGFIIIDGKSYSFDNNSFYPVLIKHNNKRLYLYFRTPEYRDAFQREVLLKRNVDLSSMHAEEILFAVSNLKYESYNTENICIPLFLVSSTILNMTINYLEIDI